MRENQFGILLYTFVLRQRQGSAWAQAGGKRRNRCRLCQVNQFEVVRAPVCEASPTTPMGSRSGQKTCVLGRNSPQRGESFTCSLNRSRQIRRNGNSARRAGMDGAGGSCCELSWRWDTNIANFDCSRSGVAALASVCARTIGKRSGSPQNRPNWLPFTSALTSSIASKIKDATAKVRGSRIRHRIVVENLPHVAPMPELGAAATEDCGRVC